MKEKVKWTINDFSYSKRIQLWGIGKALAGCLCALIFWMSALMLLHGVDSFDENHSVFETHCIKCHGKGGKVKGKVNLQELKSSDAFSSNPELLETLIKV